MTKFKDYRKRVVQFILRRNPKWAINGLSHFQKIIYLLQVK